MRKSNRLQKWIRTAVGTFVLLATLAVGLDMNAFVSLADSAGKVTATSAKIRKEPSTSSETVGSVLQDAKVSVTGQASGSDGYTWYKVTASDGVVGYIRSDLMEITDGSTPASVVTPTTSPTATPTTSTPDEPLVEVAELEPVSASISGSSSVRVRQNASTTSRIVTTAQGGLALTVVGQATGTDNKEWYQVQFISNGSEVSGFVRADYVTVSGELVPAGSVQEEPVETEPEVKEEPEQKKAWETFYTEEDGKWHLVDNTTNNSYDIAQIFSSVEANTKTLQDTLKENKNQQIIIVALVILVILLATGASFLLFKLKDMADSAYYNEVEQETMRRRTADRPVSRNQNGQKVMQTVGAEGKKKPTAQRSGQGGARPAGGQGGQRPASQRPTGAQGGQRPASQRPAGAQGGQRPASQRPAGAQGGQRPVSQRTAGTQGGQRPVSQRPAGAAQAPVRQRPVQMQEPEEEMVQNIFTDDTLVYDSTSVQQAAKAVEQERQEENTGWKAKNFANEDELEFQFLDWNEEEQ